MKENPDNQYFTPNIEDIRVGYECELLDASPPEDDWKIHIISKFDRFEFLNKWIENKEIRVPYLTKEQIEAEGWKMLEDKSPFTSKPYKYRKIIGEKETGIFNEDHIYTLEYYGIGNTNLIIHLEWESSWNRYSGNIFYGTCKDINTFRYICKLLNIN